MTKDKTTLEEAKNYVDNMYQERMELPSNEVQFTDLELASIRLLKETTLLGYKLKEQQQEIERLKEDLEYSNHCEEQMRKTITNLEYKITTLEEQLKEAKNV